VLTQIARLDNFGIISDPNSGAEVFAHSWPKFFDPALIKCVVQQTANLMKGLIGS
jgi:hypothetical protein